MEQIPKYKNEFVPIGFSPQMAYARRRKSTLLGHFFGVPLGYTLTAQPQQTPKSAMISWTQQALN